MAAFNYADKRHTPAQPWINSHYPQVGCISQTPESSRLACQFHQSTRTTHDEPTYDGIMVE